MSCQVTTALLITLRWARKVSRASSYWPSAYSAHPSASAAQHRSWSLSSRPVLLPAESGGRDLRRALKFLGAALAPQSSQNRRRFRRRAPHTSRGTKRERGGPSSTFFAPHGHELVGGRLLAQSARRLRGRSPLLQERGDGLGRLLVGVALRGAALLGDGLADFLVTRLHAVGALAVATAVERLHRGPSAAGGPRATCRRYSFGGRRHAGRVRVGRLTQVHNTRLQAQRGAS